MILYEVTCNLKEKHLEEEFVKYMSLVHVKEVLHSQCFLNASFIKTEDPGIYKSIYFVKDKETLDKYINHFAPTLRKKVTDKFPERAIEFKRSISEILFHESI